MGVNKAWETACAIEPDFAYSFSCYDAPIFRRCAYWTTVHERAPRFLYVIRQHPFREKRVRPPEQIPIVVGRVSDGEPLVHETVPSGIEDLWRCEAGITEWLPVPPPPPTHRGEATVFLLLICARHGLHDQPHMPSALGSALGPWPDRAQTLACVLRA